VIICHTKLLAYMIDGITCSAPDGCLDLVYTIGSPIHVLLHVHLAYWAFQQGIPDIIPPQPKELE
jgi:hypothetical protein